MTGLLTRRQAVVMIREQWLLSLWCVLCNSMFYSGTLRSVCPRCRSLGAADGYGEASGS